MDTSTPYIRDLAQRLLIAEATSQSAADSRMHEAVRVCEKLRICLIRFAGADGFSALMRRALALARAEVPALHGVMAKTDGSMTGLEELAADQPAVALAAAVALTAHLIGLLITLIGEPLTARLVREDWPDISWDKSP